MIFVVMINKTSEQIRKMKATKEMERRQHTKVDEKKECRMSGDRVLLRKKVRKTTSERRMC